MFSCKQRNQTAQNNPLFQKGNKIENNNFTGNAYLQSLINADTLNHIAAGNVIFEPGARSNWHTHPDGQILICLGGVGYFQEKGGPIKRISKGEAVSIKPNVLHWHGAGPDEEFVQLAITSRLKGPTQWFGPVTNDVYLHK